MTQRVAITGASGLIGGALSSSPDGPRRRGRAPRAPRPRAPPRGPVGPGRGVSWTRAPWTASTRSSTWPAPASVTTGGPRRTSSRSRLAGRRHAHGRLGAGRARRSRPVPVLVSGSAVGYYGDRGDEVLTETSSPGQGFLSDVVRAWEGASKPAVDAGLRVVYVRTGIVMAPEGGAFGPVLPLARLGLGGPLGSGPAVVAVDHAARRGPRDPAPRRPADARRAVQPHRARSRCRRSR